MRIAMILATAVVLALPPVAQATSLSGQITVTGEGRVASRPDMATVTLGVTTSADSAEAALAENSARTAQVLEELKAAGIGAQDMQTSGLSLGPRWEPAESGRGQITGFTAANVITVQVRDLPGLGGVLDTVVKNGANTFHGLNFGLQDPRPAQDEARRASVADAIARAQLYAEAAGVTLGPILSITEGGAGHPPQPMFRMAAEMSDSVPIAEGEVAVTAQTVITFQIPR